MFSGRMASLPRGVLGMGRAIVLRLFAINHVTTSPRPRSSTSLWPASSFALVLQRGRSLDCVRGPSRLERDARRPRCAGQRPALRHPLHRLPRRRPVWLSGARSDPKAASSPPASSRPPRCSSCAGSGRSPHEPSRRDRGGHHGQRHRPCLRPAGWAGHADRHRARGAREGDGDHPVESRAPGEEGHAPGRRAGTDARPHQTAGDARGRRGARQLVVEAASENPAVKFAAVRAARPGRRARRDPRHATPARSRSPRSPRAPRGPTR